MYCMGVFALRDLSIGEEITFDYKFERFGLHKQVCYCGTPSCVGFIGEKAAEKDATSALTSWSPSKNEQIPNLPRAGSELFESIHWAMLEEVESLASENKLFLHRNLRLGHSMLLDRLANTLPKYSIQSILFREEDTS